ncbi:MAG: hypothetical protein II769_05985, partial [Oscillospiraceae bacterium]|nr:hypothetical protein [Oscillospiraceae bacterium]
GGRVDTRPYEALRFGTLAQPISILPQGDRKFSILPFQFSIQQQDGGLGSGRPTMVPGDFFAVTCPSKAEMANNDRRCNRKLPCF